MKADNIYEFSEGQNFKVLQEKSDTFKQLTYEKDLQLKFRKHNKNL